MKRFLLLSFFAAAFFFALSASTYALPLPESISHLIQQVQDTAATVKEFSLTLYAVVTFFTKLLGFSAVLLLFAALVTSAGFVSVGVPAGRIAFFSALAFWDFLWILWVSASGRLDSSFIPVFAWVNAKACSPFIIFDIIRLSVPRVYRCVLRWAGKGYSRKRIASAAGDLARASARLQASISSDMASRSRRVVLSGESRSAARELKTLCERMLAGAGASESDSAENEVRNADTDT